MTAVVIFRKKTTTFPMFEKLKNEYFFIGPFFTLKQ